jgi:sorting nexin-1/2
MYMGLTNIFLQGRIVPHAPDKDVIGTTKIKISGQSENSATGGGHNSNQAGDFVEKRRNTLQRFLNRIAVHPMLRIDPDFRDFLEIDSDLPKSSSTSALSGAGVARFFSKVGETMSKISYKMDENDPVMSIFLLLF